MTIKRAMSPKTPTIAAALLLLCGTAAALIAGFTLLPAPETRLAGFTTGLEGRTAAQRHNATLAANALDGTIIAPGATFSFNRTVRSWSADRGYVKAPVSYDGELVPAFGGGVCQTSTTLYNAALRAGLPMVERHHHVFAPHYCPPGSDAAVAYPDFDLRFKNPYPFPLRVRCTATGTRLTLELWGARHPDTNATVETRVLSRTDPQRMTRLAARLPDSLPAPESSTGRNPGMVGYRVVTYRVFSRADNGQEVRRERLSDDSYPAMDRLITTN